MNRKGIAKLSALFLIVSAIGVFGYFMISANASTINYTQNQNNVSQTSWNETFTGNQNNTFWINIPKYAQVMDAKLNLTGDSNYNDLIFYNDGTLENEKWLVNFTKGTQNATLNKQTGVYFAGSDGFGSIWENGLNPPFGERWINWNTINSKGNFYRKVNYTSNDTRRWMTVESWANRSLSHIEYFINCGSDTACYTHPGIGGVASTSGVSYFYTNGTNIKSGINTCSGYPGSIGINDFNRTLFGFNVSGGGSIIIYNISNATSLTYSPALRCLPEGGQTVPTSEESTVLGMFGSSIGIVDLQFDLIIMNETTDYSTSNIIKSYNGNYSYNPYIDVSQNGNKDWQFGGEFSQSNNRTANFSSEIQSYLSTCTAKADGTCDVPFILHSDTAGKIQISDINITYSLSYPSWSANSTSKPTPQTYNPSTNYGFQINSSASNGMNNTWFQLGRPSGTLINYTAFNNSASGKDVWYYNLTQSALGEAGTYNYTWFLNDTENLQNKSDTVNYVINKAATLMNLSLNGTQGNRSYRQNEIANFTSWLNVSGKTISLLSNYSGFIMNTSSGTIFNYTTLLNVGNYYNLTANWTGDENYTGTQIDYLFNVTIPILSVSIVPSPAQVTNDLNCTYNYLNSAGYPQSAVWFQWYINSTANATVQNLTSSNLTLGANIVCSVKLFDGTANSSWTNSSTLTIGDTVSPILKNASLSADANYANNPFTIYVNATEANSMNYVYVEMTDPNAVKTNFTMAQDGRSGLEYKFSKIYTPIITGDYSFKFFASDGSGNVANLTTTLIYSVWSGGGGSPSGGGSGSPSPSCNVGYSLIGGVCQSSDIGFSVSPTLLSINASFAWFQTSSQIIIENTGNQDVNLSVTITSEDGSDKFLSIGTGLQTLNAFDFTLKSPTAFNGGQTYLQLQASIPNNQTGTYRSTLVITNKQNGASVKIPIIISAMPSSPLPLGTIILVFGGIAAFVIIVVVIAARNGRKRKKYY